MAIQRPIVLSNGSIQQLPIGDLVAGAAAGSPQPITTTFAGTLTVFTGITRYYPEQDIILGGVYFAIGTTSSLGDVVIDIKKNGTSIMGGVYPTITPTNFKSNIVTISTTILTTDYITVDITSAGTGVTNALITIIVASGTGLGGGGSGVKSLNAYFLGNNTNITGTIRRYLEASSTISAIYVRVPTAIATNAVITLKKNGSVINTSTLLATTTEIVTTGLSLSVAFGDYLTMDLASAGITDVSIQILYS